MADTDRRMRAILAIAKQRNRPPLVNKEFLRFERVKGDASRLIIDDKHPEGRYSVACELLKHGLSEEQLQTPRLGIRSKHVPQNDEEKGSTDRQPSEATAFFGTTTTEVFPEQSINEAFLELDTVGPFQSTTHPSPPGHEADGDGIEATWNDCLK